jgi:hypothetical protein
VLQQIDWWGKDLREVPELSSAVALSIRAILTRGMRAAMALAAEPEPEPELEEETSVPMRA